MQIQELKGKKDEYAYVDELQLLTGIDISMPLLGVTIHQPKIKEISFLQEKNYFLALKIFLTRPSDYKILDSEVTSWMLVKKFLSQDIPGVPSTYNLINNFLKLFIPQSNIGVSAVEIQGENGELIELESEQFELLQKVVGEVGGKFLIESATKDGEDEFKPANSRAAEIAEKIKRGKKKLAEQQGSQGNISLIYNYVKGIAISTANSLEEVLNMTLYQLYTLMTAALDKEQYEQEISARLAGASSDSKLVHWLFKPAKDREKG